MAPTEGRVAKPERRRDCHRTTTTKCIANIHSSIAQ